MGREDTLVPTTLHTLAFCWGSLTLGTTRMQMPKRLVHHNYPDTEIKVGKGGEAGAAGAASGTHQVPFTSSEPRKMIRK